MLLNEGRLKIMANLPKLKQIEGALDLVNVVEQLKPFLNGVDASKVNTSFPVDADDASQGVITLDAYLKSLPDYSETIQTLSDTVSSISDKKVIDPVSYTFGFEVSEDGAVTVSQSFLDAVDDNFKNVTDSAVPVYTYSFEDNGAGVQAYAVDGDVLSQVYFDASTGLFYVNVFNSETGATEKQSIKAPLYVATSETDEEGKTVNKELTTNDTLRVFVKKEYTFKDIPADYQVDNDAYEEFQRQVAVKTLAAQIASNKALLAEVQEKIKDETIQQAISDLTDQTATVNGRVNTLVADSETEGSIAYLIAQALVDYTPSSDSTAISDEDLQKVVAEIQTKIDEISYKTVTENVTLAEGAAAIINFASKYDDTYVIDESSLIKLFVNGLTYVEGEAFSVSRTDKTIVWTYTAANEGFDLDADDVIIVEYTVGKKTEEKVEEPTEETDSTPSSEGGEEEPVVDGGTEGSEEGEEEQESVTDGSETEETSNNEEEQESVTDGSETEETSNNEEEQDDTSAND
jgi:hypothetical protein